MFHCNNSFVISLIVFKEKEKIIVNYSWISNTLCDVRQQDQGFNSDTPTTLYKSASLELQSQQRLQLARKGIIQERAVGQFSKGTD